MLYIPNCRSYCSASKYVFGCDITLYFNKMYSFMFAVGRDIKENKFSTVHDTARTFPGFRLNLIDTFPCYWLSN